jgi:2-haloacid dehalogenase
MSGHHLPVGRRDLLRGLAAALLARGMKATDTRFDPSSIRALTFDVFGTVVDWRGSIIREASELGRAKRIEADWARFADVWRSGYGPAMDRVRRGELPWTNIDNLHRMILDRLLPEFKIDGLSEAEKQNLNRAWHRLEPWPDTVGGLTRLRAKFIIATLSNGNVALLVNMAKHARLPWDCILSAELVKRYKPDLEVYQMACDLLGLRPEQVMMVAAHKGDLRASQKIAMRTAFVQRPLEFGKGRVVDTAPDPSFDITAADFEDLAAKLGA